VRFIVVENSKIFAYGVYLLKFQGEKNKVMSTNSVIAIRILLVVFVSVLGILGVLLQQHEEVGELRTADSGSLHQQEEGGVLTAVDSKVLSLSSPGFENVTCIPRVCQQPKHFVNDSNTTRFTLLASFPGSGNTWLRGVSKFLITKDFWECYELTNQTS
jgi:hypothetical protein